MHTTNHSGVCMWYVPTLAYLWYLVDREVRLRMVEPKKTRTVRVNFRCWPTVGITTIYSFVTPNKPHRTTSQNGRNTTVWLPPP